MLPKDEGILLTHHVILTVFTVSFIVVYSFISTCRYTLAASPKAKSLFSLVYINIDSINALLDIVGNALSSLLFKDLWGYPSTHNHPFHLPPVTLSGLTALKTPIHCFVPIIYVRTPSNTLFSFSW